MVLDVLVVVLFLEQRQDLNDNLISPSNFIPKIAGESAVDPLTLGTFKFDSCGIIERINPRHLNYRNQLIILCQELQLLQEAVKG